MEKDIDEIITKSLADKVLNTEEKHLKDSWLRKSGNKVFYNVLYRYCKEARKKTDGKQIDVNRAYQKHLKYMHVVKVSKRKQFVARMLPYAAIVALVFGVFSLMLFLGNDTTITPDQQWLSTIDPGSQKAELVLADGRVMNLEEKKEEQIKEKDGTHILNTGKTLIYDKNKKNRPQKTSYNSLLVPRGGEYQLVLEDGTKVWVNSESRLRYPTFFHGDTRTVILEGEAYFEVSEDKNCPFIVKTQGVNIKVLGTSFNVASYLGDEDILTTLVEGRVEVSDSERAERKVVLNPGYQARFNRKGHGLKTKKVNVDLYTSWKDGRFVFENTSLKELMNQLARWYDVEILYSNVDAKNIRFSGGLKRYDNLEELLKMIEKTNDVKFVMKEKTITVGLNN